nr:CLJU_RS11820 family redox protein [Desulfonatronum thioautotrophicum]
MQRFPDLNVRYADWTCGHCGGPLQLCAVKAAYMGSEFELELPGCPACGLYLVFEELALGKMLEVERLLEDK